MGELFPFEIAWLCVLGVVLLVLVLLAVTDKKE